jgi:predicted nuclease of restriction endonuclease-like (RecB) superfamily
MSDLSPNDYATLLSDIEQRIRTRQTRAILAVNRKNIELYWEIGELVVQRQEQQGWGDAVVERLAKDLQAKFPGMSGFSRPNVFFMRRSYLTYRDTSEIVLQAVRLFPFAALQG